jgi:hypothetical protein
MSRGFATMRSTLLLLVDDNHLLTDLTYAARSAGLTAVPGRHHELAIDSLTRVHSEAVLIHVTHEGADSIAFNALAHYRGTKVFLFARRDGSEEERARVALVSARSPYPVLQYTTGAELIAAVKDALGQPHGTLEPPPGGPGTP